jgi:hypothetical protein
VSGDVDLSPARLRCQPPKIDQKQMIQIRRESKSEQDNTNGNDPKREMTRRTTLSLAAAVATFGAAMGMRAPAAWAQGKMEGKEEGKADGKMEGKGEGKADGKMEGKGEGKREGKGEGKAEGKREGKGEGKGEGKMEGKREGKADGKMEGKGEGKMEGKAGGKI